jgi:acetyl-CoA acetyltransferase
MREIAIVSFAQTTSPRTDQDDAEMLLPALTEALAAVSLKKADVGFTVSGSCDYLGGRPFSFVMAVDAVGAWPPIEESHVEMDGAWALYEAWVRLLEGDIDIALVYSFGRQSQGDLDTVLTHQLDPFTVAPLGIDATSIAALQARAMLDKGICTELDMAAVASRARRHAKGNPHATVHGDTPAESLLASPYTVAPLRAHDGPPVTDGAACVILATGDRARALTKRPAWIRGIEHRVESQGLGLRDLTRSVSTELAAKASGALDAKPQVAEIYAPYSHQEILVARALGLGDEVIVNPSGGALASHPYMSAGLVRLGEAARRVMDGTAKRAIAHATSGPCLQQNLVCVLGDEP